LVGFEVRVWKDGCGQPVDNGRERERGGGLGACRIKSFFYVCVGGMSLPLKTLCVWLVCALRVLLAAEKLQCRRERKVEMLT
jgi:hypothetical protein